MKSAIYPLQLGEQDLELFQLMRVLRGGKTLPNYGDVLLLGTKSVNYNLGRLGEGLLTKATNKQKDVFIT